MEEIRNQILNNSNTKKELAQIMKETSNQNIATKEKLRIDAMKDGLIQKKMLDIVSKTMLKMEDEIDEKDNIIDGYKKYIGDDNTNNDIIKKLKEQRKTLLNDELKKRSGRRLMETMKECLAIE